MLSFSRSQQLPVVPFLGAGGSHNNIPLYVNMPTDIAIVLVLLM